MANYNYQACVAFVRKQEGGNTDTPGDRGGRTGRGGITHSTYDVYRDKKGLPRQDVFLINGAEIAEIYWKSYWQPIRGDELTAGADLCIFDYAINSGPTKANLAHLQAIRAGATAPASLIHRICKDRLSFMHSLGSWSRFGPGWGRRVAECEAAALLMANMPLAPALKTATAAKSGYVKKVGGTVIAGSVGGAGAHQLIEHGLLALVAIGGIIIFAASISAFNAWRQAQRVDALTAAIKDMQVKQTAAFAARLSADAQVAAKQKAIDAEQTALAAAKDAISRVQMS